MRRSTDFASVVQSGVRRTGGPLVVHQQLDFDGPVPLVGFVVGKNVGGSVVRHRVSRRMRAEVARRLGELPPRSATVIRARPEATAATSREIGAGLDQALARLASRR
jgi:ribonuclease P protein component